VTTCKYLLLLIFCEGVHCLLVSLETDDTKRKEQKAAEKYRQHQITLLQQQITKLEEHRDELKNVVSLLCSDTVCCCVVTYCPNAFISLSNNDQKDYISQSFISCNRHIYCTLLVKN